MDRQITASDWFGLWRPFDFDNWTEMSFLSLQNANYFFQTVLHLLLLSASERIADFMQAFCTGLDFVQKVLDPVSLRAAILP